MQNKKCDVCFRHKCFVQSTGILTEDAKWGLQLFRICRRVFEDLSLLCRIGVRRDDLGSDPAAGSLDEQS